MNVLALEAAYAHINDLLADAEARRRVAAVKPNRPSRVASLVGAIRRALEPQPLPRLGGYPYRS